MFFNNYKDERIIVFSGKLGVGKDFVSDRVCENLKSKGYNPFRIAAADMLKIMCMGEGNEKENNYESFYVNKTAESRDLLRTVAEDYRDKKGEDIWLRYLKAFIDVFSRRGFTHFIISDLRYKNELKYYRNLTGFFKAFIVRIHAPKRNMRRLEQEVMCYAPEDRPFYRSKAANHISECDLDDVPITSYDCYLLNDEENIDQYNDFVEKFSR